MLPTLTSMLWCLVQISIVTTVVLAIAGSLRGRFPQWTSSLLAGAGICVLALGTLALLPSTQWSVAVFVASSTESEQGTGNTLENSATRQTINGALKSRQSTELGNTDSDGVAVRYSTSEEAGIDRLRFPEAYHSSSTSISQIAGLAADWFVDRLQNVDNRFRDYEQINSKSAATVSVIKWLGLALIVLFSGMWLIGWQWIRQLVSHSTLIEDGRVQYRVREFCSQMKCDVPELRQSSKVAVGATLGYLRPRIILSHNWQAWTDDELDAVLLHELAHQVRADFAWVILGSWLRVLFFYHPLVLLLVRRWRMEQELAADQIAASWMKSAKAYGRALASLALQVQSPSQMRGVVLTAEQVCIVRRVTMLKQGSLKPSRYRWRSVMALTVLTVVGLLPLSGVRGKTALADDKLQEKSIQTSDKELTDGTEKPKANQEQQKAKLAEFKRAQEAFPALEIVGRLKWCPGKLVTEDVDPTALYFQDLIAFTLLEQFPEKAEINCPATVKLAWEDMNREHGRLELGAMCNQSHGVDPKLMARMVTSQALGTYKATNIKKMIEGKEAVGIVTCRWTDDFSAREYETEPHIWLVQDGEEFYYGSEADIATRIRKASGGETADAESKDSALIDVPEQFQLDFDNSTLALVYSDCDQWAARIQKHLDGSPKQAEAAMFFPFLSGLEKMGLFVSSEGGATIKLRVRYDSVRSAERGAKGIRSLIAMAQAANNSDKTAGAIINSMQVETIGQETILSSRPATNLKEIQQSLFSETVKNWTAVLSTIVTIKSKDQWVDVKSVTSEGTDRGVVKLNCGNPIFGTACFMSQSLDAARYHGQRVRLIAELGCEDLMHDHCGVILWSADGRDNSVANATSGNSMTLVEEKNPAMDKLLLLRDVPPPIVWREHSIELDVRDNASVLSLGIYTSIADVLVRNVRFEIAGEATGEQPKHALANSPRNLLHLPGGPLLSQPSNLDFRQLPDKVQQPSTTGSEATTRSAVQPDSGKLVR